MGTIMNLYKKVKRAFFCSTDKKTQQIIMKKIKKGAAWRVDDVCIRKAGEDDGDVDDDDDDVDGDVCIREPTHLITRPDIIAPCRAHPPQDTRCSTPKYQPKTDNVRQRQTKSDKDRQIHVQCHPPPDDNPQKTPIIRGKPSLIKIDFNKFPEMVTS